MEFSIFIFFFSFFWLSLDLWLGPFYSFTYITCVFFLLLVFFKIDCSLMFSQAHLFQLHHVVIKLINASFIGLERSLCSRKCHLVIVLLFYLKFYLNAFVSYNLLGLYASSNHVYLSMISNV